MTSALLNQIANNEEREENVLILNESCNIDENINITFEQELLNILKLDIRNACNIRSNTAVMIYNGDLEFNSGEVVGVSDENKVVDVDVGVSDDNKVDVVDVGVSDDNKIDVVVDAENDDDKWKQKKELRSRIIIDCDHLARYIVEDRLDSDNYHKNIESRYEHIYKRLSRGIDIYFIYGNTILENNARELWVTNQCEYATFCDVAKKLILNDISWVQICGLFAFLDSLAIFCKMFGRGHIAKVAAGHLSTFIEENENIMNFLEENGGWENIFGNKLMIQDVVEEKNQFYVRCVKLAVLGMLYLWRFF